MPFRQFVTLATIGVVAMWAIPVYGQGDGAQRSGGLFGATRSDTGDRNRLNVLFAASQGFESNIPVEFRSQVPNSGPQPGGYSTLFTTSADYMNAGRRLEFAGTAQSAFRYYQRAKVSSTSHSAGLRAQVQLSREATLQISQTAAYSPSYLFQLFPSPELPLLEEPIAPALEYQFRETESYSYRTRVFLDAGSAQASRFSLAADYGHTDFRRQVVERPDVETYGGRGKYTYSVGRSARVSAEYQYRAAELGFAPYTEHRVNFGGEYSRALSTSRRATVRVSLSPSWLDISDSAPSAPVTGRVFRLQGQGQFDYQFRRTWRASGSYRRSVEYVPVALEPVFANSVRVGVSGLIARMVDVSGSAGYADGESALSRRSRQLDTYTGTARVRFALTRGFALYTEYFYYFYDLRGPSLLPPGLANTFEQQGMRAGLMLWVPVF